MAEVIGVIFSILVAVGIMVLGVFVIIWNGNSMIEAGHLGFWPVMGVLLGIFLAGLPSALAIGALTSD